MADNKKYYYMRLKEDFFDSEEMILLEAMPDGVLYQNILMKMYCRSLKSEGRLMLNGIIPYNSQMLAAITRQQVGVVEKALQVFQELGLIEILDNGAIYMLNIQNYIGESSSEGDRKREYRKAIETEKTNVGQMSTIDIDIATTKATTKAITNSISKERIESEKPKRERFTPPTVEEVKAYCQETGKLIDAEAFVNYYTSNGWKVGRNPMKNWKTTVANWRKRDEESGRIYKEPVIDHSLDEIFPT